MDHNRYCINNIYDKYFDLYIPSDNPVNFVTNGERKKCCTRLKNSNVYCK